MEKLTNSFYLDYNATSPLSPRVRDYLESGDFIFANPSSAYQLGKSSRKTINQSLSYIFNLFGLDNQIYQLVFHSGGTEGINTLLFGAALHEFKRGGVCDFFFSPTDHACVINLKENIESLGHKVHFIKVNENGEVDVEDLIKNIKSLDEGHRKIVNWTWLNNETGVINDLSVIEHLKSSVSCEVVCDAVQAPGKISTWNILNSELDAYSFSSHKFGGLKGVGFSFIKDSYRFQPLIMGGNQQKGLRSGTENPMGVYTTELALRDLVDQMTEEVAIKMDKFKKKIEDCLISRLGAGCIVGYKAKSRNLNTVSFIVPSVKATTLLMAFDLEGLQVSSGSACSSGANIPSRVLSALGVDSSLTRSGIRLSFSRDTIEKSDAETSKILEKLSELIERYVEK